MQMFLSTACLWDRELPDILKFAREAGFDGVEIWAGQLQQKNSATCLNQLASQLGLDLCCHAVSWDLNLCSHHYALRQIAVDEIKQSICTAKDLGTKSVTVHPGRRSAPVLDLNLYRVLLAQSLQELCQFARQIGVQLSLELMEPAPGEFVTTPMEMNTLLDLIAPFSCGVTLDVAHLESAAMFHHYLAELPRADKLHLSNRRGQTYHTPVFEGDIDMYSVLGRLRTLQLPIIVEGNKLCPEQLIHILQEIRRVEGLAA